MTNIDNPITSEFEVPPWAAGTAQRMHELDPELSDDEIAILLDHGDIQHFAAGARLWDAGEIGSFMLVLEGGIDVVNRTSEGEKLIISIGPNHYIGETVTMSGGRALVSGVANKDLKALVITPENIRRVIATEPDLGEKLLQSFILRRMRMVAERLSNVLLVGDTRQVDCHALESFLSRNGVPFETVFSDKVLDDRDEKSLRFAKVLARHSLKLTDLPAIIINDVPLSRPSIRELAEELGFTVKINAGHHYDVAVIGSGPAGLTAAVYAASEGLDVIVLESCAPGGQAASSSKIENYMGFPTGISGQALMGRAYLQAQKFGAHIAVARELVSFEPGHKRHKLYADGGDEILAKTVIVASGAIYRQPPIAGLDGLGGVHYGASHLEGELCRGRDVAVIGGGNSAGQAAMYLSKRARTVHIFIRGKDLSSSMSSYLIDRIASKSNVKVHSHTEVKTLHGDKHLTGIEVINNQTEQTQSFEISNLFVFIGAQPGTAFLEGQIALDGKGFVLTGDELDDKILTTQQWPHERRPYLLETSCPRVFAAGDVRAGSIKRVATAVGEGSVCIQLVHRVIEQMQM